MASRVSDQYYHRGTHRCLCAFWNNHQLPILSSKNVLPSLTLGPELSLKVTQRLLSENCTEVIRVAILQLIGLRSDSYYAPLLGADRPYAGSSWIWCVGRTLTRAAVVDASQDLIWQELASHDDRELAEEQLLECWKQGVLTSSEFELRKERLYKTQFLGEVFSVLIVDSSKLSDGGMLGRHLILVNAFGLLAFVLLLFGAGSGSATALVFLLATVMAAFFLDILHIRANSHSTDRYGRRR